MRGVGMDSPRCAPSERGVEHRMAQIDSLWEGLGDALDHGERTPTTVQRRRRIKETHVLSGFGRTGALVASSPRSSRILLSARSSPARPGTGAQLKHAATARKVLSAREPSPAVSTAAWTQGADAAQTIQRDSALRHCSPRYMPRPALKQWKRPLRPCLPPEPPEPELPRGAGYDYPVAPSRPYSFVLAQRVLDYGDTRRRWRAWHPSLLKTEVLEQGTTTSYASNSSGLHQFESMYWAKQTKLDIEKAINYRKELLVERGEADVPSLASVIDKGEEKHVYTKIDILKHYISAVGAQMRTVAV